MHSIEYERYMRSPQWRRKRQQRLDFDHHRCAACGIPESDEIHLQVHHTNYMHFRDEVIEHDLVSLCPACHRKLHKALGYGNDWRRRSR